MKRKFNWIELKKQYLAASVADIRQWWRSIGGERVVSERSLDRNTVGWKEEYAKIKQKGLERAIEKHVEQSSIPNEKLLRMKENLLIIIGNKIAKERETLSANDLKNLINVIKVELGEPTNISENTNLNKNVTLPADINFTDTE